MFLNYFITNTTSLRTVLQSENYNSSTALFLSMQKVIRGVLLGQKDKTWGVGESRQ